MNEFDRRKNTPQYWYNKASDLRASAGAVWHCMRAPEKAEIATKLGLGAGFDMGIATHHVFPMLCGLSLELLFKAICVKSGVAFANTHNLMKLAESAGISLPLELVPFVKIFTESIIWSGKYPVPVDKQRDALDELSELRKGALFDDTGFGSDTMRIYRSNGKLNWETFDSVWALGYERYFNISEPCETP